MYTPDEKTEELLNGYLDGYLSDSETRAIEASLASDELLRQHLESLKVLQSDLREMLQSPTSKNSRPTIRGKRKSNADLFQQVVAEARKRAASDPVHAGATWVLPESQKEVAVSTAKHKHADHRWIWVMAGLAASLVIAGGWLIQSRLQSDSDKLQRGLIANLDSKLPAESKLHDNNRDDNQSIEKPVDSSSQGLVASQEPQLSSPSQMKEATKETTKQVTNESIAAIPAAVPSNVSSNQFVKPNLQPSAEQIAALEKSLKGSVNLSYLLVVDISLRDHDESLEVLDQILTRYDIPSAVDLDVQESTLKKLADSRLIASGKVVLPDSKPKAIPNDVDATEVAELMFVKARGERLDAAIIEIMQRVDAFPEFSMDMAFDAPAQALASELRFIQETALPKNAPIAKSSIASMLSTRANTGGSIDRFQAPSRRGVPLAADKRVGGKGPNGLGAEMMNPISCAILILREPK